MSVLEARYDELGQLVRDGVPERAEQILLYAEFDDGVISAFLAYGLDGKVFQVLTGDALLDELFRLQEQFGLDVKAMEFVLVGESFNVHFTHASSGGGGMDFSGQERREELACQKYFGHCSVIPADWPAAR